MAFDLDPFSDILSEPAEVNARAGAKFQPKAKPRSKKGTPILVPSNLSDSTKENSVAPASRHEDISQSVYPHVDGTQIGSIDPDLSSVDTSTIVPCTTTLTGPSLHLETREPVNSAGVLHQGVSMTDSDRSSVPADISQQLFTTKGDVNSTETLNFGYTNNSDIRGDILAGFGRSGGEAADFFSELESLDILSELASSNVGVVRKFQPKVKTKPQPRNKLPISRSVTNAADHTISQPEDPSLQSSNIEGMEAIPSLPVLSSVDSTFRACSFIQTNTIQDFIVSQELINNRETAASDNGDLWMDNGRLEREEEEFPDMGSFDIHSQGTTTTGDAQFVPETEYLDEDLTPAHAPDGFPEFSTMSFSDYVPTDVPSELQITEDLTNLNDSSGTEVPLPEEIVDSPTVHVTSKKESIETRKRKTSTIMEDTTGMVYSTNVEEILKGTMDERSVFAASEGNETGKSSRQHRKRSSTRVVADEIEEGTPEDGDLLYEPSSNSLVDEDDDECRDETSNHKKPCKKSKKPVVENVKTIRRRKISSEGPDSSNREPPKKKFSHSTRTNKRRVNKVLLETPEEELNPRKLIIKDLILLAEAKERLLSKDATASKNSFPCQRNSFTRDSPYDRDDPFASMQGQYADDDQATPTVQESSLKLNYHSYMDKIPRERWSKQDTELFYEAVRQFGTDFAMIQQLFPNRTRHQVKLKYKKEERQQPMKLYDALTHRSKDHSHFELVMERLQKAAAEAEGNSNKDAESVDLSDEEEEEEVEKVEQEEVGTLSDQKKEDVTTTNDMEPTVTEEVHSPVKSHEREEGDVYDRWSQYKSDYDVF